MTGDVIQLARPRQHGGPPRARAQAPLLDSSSAVTFDQLSSTTCRWPLWDALPAQEDMRFCGALPEADSSYCPTCRERARRFKTKR